MGENIEAVRGEEDIKPVEFREILDLNSGKFLIQNSITSDEASEIMFVKNIATGEDSVVKIFEPSHLEDFLREARALERLQGHSNIIKLRGKERSQGKNFLIMERGGIELIDYIEKKGGCIQEDEARELFLQMLIAVKHCHDNSLCHHDLKLENFLIDQDHNQVKLIDFGFSIDMSGHSPHILSGGFISGRYTWFTPLYASKQLLFREDHNFEKTDIFSLGICLYAMLTGRFPWYPQDDSFETLRRNIIERKNLEFPHPFNTSLSSEVKDLLRQMLAFDENVRLTVSDALTHPWVSLNHVYVTRIS
jgi:serine/threonine protein kinase